MRIAVTGATGFVGRHVVPALIARGARVTAMLRDDRERKSWLAGCDIAKIDVASPGEDAFEKLGRPDVVVHLAWQGLPNYKSLHHFESELPLQYRFLRSLIESGLRRLVVTGTCFEYGMQSGSLTETMAPAPTNPYGFAKDALRRQLDFLKASRPFALVWARLFYMYGEGQAANSLLPQLERAIAAGDATFNMSVGEQLRDYLPVDEVARVLAHIAVADGDCGVLNICSGKPISVRALVEDVIAQRRAAIRLNRGYYPYPDFEPMAFWGDRTKLDRFLASDPLD